MTDRSDAVELTYRPLRGPRQRIVFEPRDDGRYLREAYVWGGCAWRYTGGEIVEDVTIDEGAEVVTA